MQDMGYKGEAMGIFPHQTVWISHYCSNYTGISWIIFKNPVFSDYKCNICSLQKFKKKFLTEAKKSTTLLYYSEKTTLNSWESPTPGLSVGSFQTGEAFILDSAL